jgi:hypothetical protein
MDSQIIFGVAGGALLLISLMVLFLKISKRGQRAVPASIIAASAGLGALIYAGAPSLDSQVAWAWTVIVVGTAGGFIMARITRGNT